MGSVILEAMNVAKSYKKGPVWVPVLRGVSLKIEAGSTLAIMGASGAGKSTLLHVLGALDRPTGGHVVFGPKQVDLWTMDDDALSTFRNANLGFVFQFHYLLPEFSALENAMMPGLIAGWSRPEAERRAREVLDQVGLRSRVDHRPAELSGGEQQRVAIARAIVMRPPILLADELTGNLDSENGKRVMDLLLELNQSLKIAILSVTHDPIVAKRMDRVLTMRDGELLVS